MKQLSVILNTYLGEWASNRSDSSLKPKALAQLAPLVTLWNKRLNTNSVTVMQAVIMSALANNDETAIRVLPHHATLALLEMYANIPLLKGSVANEFERWFDKVAPHATWGTDNFSEFLEERGFIDTSDGITLEGNTWWCEHCDEHHSSNTDSLTVVTELRGTRPCDSITSCERMDTFYCDVSGHVFSSRDFCADQTEDGDSICGEWAGEAGWHCNHSGRWSESQSTSIPSYHSANRGIIYDALINATPIESMADRLFGVELEIDFLDSDDRERWYDGNIPYGRYAVAEQDGSLDDETGLEIITAPLPYATWCAQGNQIESLVESARDSGARGWSMRANYGVHVNMDMRDTTEQQRFMFYAAVNNMGGLYSLVSGRALWSGSYKKVVAKHIAMSSRDVWSMFRDQTGQHNESKYQPVVMKTGGNYPFAEIRCFGSNLRKRALAEYVQLCASTLDWVTHLTLQPQDGESIPPLMVYGDNVHHAYLTWLDEQSGYEDLKALLAKFGNLHINEQELYGISRN